MIAPIYIYRPVSLLSAIAISEYAFRIGIENPVYDLHVTLAYSREPVDWDAPVFQMDPTYLTIQQGGRERALRVFDGGAVVLPVRSNALDGRWAQFLGGGASWDHDDYMPHITLGYDETFSVEDVDELYPYEVKFAPESREPLEL